MPEKINENVIEDATKKPEKESGIGLEIFPSPELTSVVNSLDKIKQAVGHNQPVNSGQLQQIQEAAKKLTVNFYGEKMTVKEIEKIPDLEKNMKIWEEIRQGDFENTSELTHITSEIAKRLFYEQGNLYLSRLLSLSNEAAEHLSHHRGLLDLSKLTSLSDKAAENLFHHQGDLWLSEITSLSDQAAEHLSHNQGLLDLSGLASLSDKAAEHLSNHQDGILRLDGLTSLSDKATECLAKHKEEVWLPEFIKKQMEKFKK